jgi:hypothetical protein
MRNSKAVLGAFFVASFALATLSATSAKAQELVQIDVSGPATLRVGDVQQYSATGTMDDGSTVDLTVGASWVSSDETVASVNSADQAGQVTAAGPGQVTISAWADNGAVGSLTVTVEDPNAPQQDPNLGGGSDLTPGSQP